MNQAIKKEWVEALLSGKYQQGEGVLKKRDYVNNTNAYCCLGVLVDLAIKSGVDIEVERDENNYNEDYFFDGCNEFLPMSVMQWAELKHDNGWFNHGVFQETLAELNDKGRSFAELADIISKYF